MSGLNKSPNPIVMELRVYSSAFRIRFSQGLQYRAAALAGLMTQFFWGAMLIFVYIAFYRASSNNPPMALSQTVTYVWLHQSFLALLMFWYRDPEILGTITDGNVAYEMCRPTNLYWMWYARLLAGRVAGTALRFAPILVAAFLLPEPYRIRPPVSVAAFFGFVAAMTLGVLIMISLTMFIYEWTMRTMDPTGPMVAFGSVGEFFSGGILPVPLMPDWLQPFVLALPFRFTVDLPFRVWSGSVPVSALPAQLLAGLAWLAVTAGSGMIWMERNKRCLIVQGG